MIERHVTFHVLPDRGQLFAEFFLQEYMPAMAKSKGFIKAELLRDVGNYQDHTMVLRFESLDAAAAWRASSDHAVLKPKLKSMYEGSQLKVFEVIQESMNYDEAI